MTFDPTKHAGPPERIRNTALKAARAMMLIKGKVDGLSHEELAAQIGRHPETVRRELNWAEKQGLVDQYQRHLLQSLVPKAIDAYSAVLDADAATLDKDTVRAHKLKLEAGRDIVRGTGVMQERSPAKNDFQAIDIYAYYEHRTKQAARTALPDQAGHPGGNGAAEAAALVGEIVDEASPESGADSGGSSVEPAAQGAD